MKHITLIIGILLISLSLVQAQSKSTTFIEIFGGFSKPLGNFSQADYRNPVSGFAKSGSIAGISGALFFGGNLGVGATISHSSYGVNTFALADGYREDFAVDEATASSKRYTATNFLAGPYYSLSVGPLTLDLRALLGASAATLPALRVALEDQSTFRQNKATATAFAYQVGAGLRARLFHNVGLSLRADYLTAKPDFVVSYDGINNSSGRTISTYHQSMASVNATVGILYQFGR